MAPPDARFGWPRRNGFVQPLVDAELLSGLDRFDHVEVRWSRRMEACTESADGVTVQLSGESSSTVKARYVVGCDGGRSATRGLMGVSFDGTTSPTRWLVIDVANGTKDPQPAHFHLGTCDKYNPHHEFNLTPVVDGKSTTTLDTTVDKLTGGDMVINVHKSAVDVATIASCAVVKS